MAMESTIGAGGNRDAAELVRILERQLKEARSIDTEALCIVAGERVSAWWGTRGCTRVRVRNTTGC